MKYIILILLISTSAFSKMLYFCEMEIRSRDYDKMAAEYISLKVEKRWIFGAKVNSQYEVATIWGKSNTQLKSKKAKRLKLFGVETLRVQNSNLESNQDYRLNLKIPMQEAFTEDGVIIVKGLSGVFQYEDKAGESGQVETYDVVTDNAACYLNPEFDHRRERKQKRLERKLERKLEKEKRKEARRLAE